MPSILFLVPAEYDALLEKGVEHMIFERDERGFFYKVITVHPFANKTRAIKLNEIHEIHEIGFDLFASKIHEPLLKKLQLPIHFFRIINRTIKLIKKNKIDLIRANDPYWMGLFGYICSRISNIPFCVSIHADHDKRMELDNDISMATIFGSYKLAKYLEHFIFSKAAMIMPIRESLGYKAMQNGASQEKIRVIPHGINLAPFLAPPRHHIHHYFAIDEDVKIISFVGRFSKENYLDDMLEIVSKLGHKRDDFVLVMVGGGKEEERIKSVVSSNQFLSTHVIMAGFQPRDICLDLRRASYVSLCLMAGYSLIEACAAARPVVSYDIEWHSELVKDKETGFLVNEHDIDSVVMALRWLFDHPEEAEAIGQNAKVLAFERHDLKKTSDTKVRWYSELLALEN